MREKASAEHRDIERALTRFIAKTGDTENLFPDDPYAFPCKLSVYIPHVTCYCTVNSEYFIVTNFTAPDIYLQVFNNAINIKP